MICVSAPGGKVQEAALRYPSHLVEARLDLGGSPDDLRGIERRTMITIRRREEWGSWRWGEEERKALMRRAIDLNPRYVDLEISSAIYDLIDEARDRSVGVVASIHLGRSDWNLLLSLQRKAISSGAEVFKAVITPSCIGDCVKMMTMTASSKIPMVGICLGELGVITRFAAPLVRSPFTYASPWRLAPGQPTPEELEEVWRSWDLM